MLLSILMIYILVAGANEEEHIRRLEEVLLRLAKVGLHDQRNKCQFKVSSVSFLGHRIDGDGFHPLPEKVDAVLEAPAPLNVRELKSHLGLLSYYSKYLPNLSSVLTPLYQLLHKDVRWKWSGQRSRSFSALQGLTHVSTFTSSLSSESTFGVGM